jgi:phenylpropionate dioxygenase-like ring-hydroxylating dioxygenase large terminal subunit
MLSVEDNEILTRVGPGTLMGNLLRRFWVPALLSLEVPEPDSPPVRVRILGEDLIGFRATNGEVGLVANACPHRGASLFFGRNEESGLRCVYHGWKFDVTGACVDMPSEPAESNFKSKVHVLAYPTHEWNGYVWAFMGPPDKMYLFREIGPPVPREQWPTGRVLSECNWVQALEGNIDSSHISYLHRNLDELGLQSDETDKPGVPSNRMSTVARGYDRAPRIELVETWYGFRYAGLRTTPNGYTHVRLTEYILPWTTRVSQLPLSNGFSFASMVPRDDYTCWRGASGRVRRTPQAASAAGAVRAYDQEYLASIGAFSDTVQAGGIAPRPQRKDNDYLLDRDKQKAYNYTGIVGTGQQDMAVTESMGEIYDRSHEHLGTTDGAIIMMRRQLIRAAKNLARGIEPATADTSLPLEKILSAERIILPEDDWTKLGTDEDPLVAEKLAPTPLV